MTRTFAVSVDLTLLGKIDTRGPGTPSVPCDSTAYMEERNMHQITTGNCGLVLDTEGGSRRSGKATDQRPSSPNKDAAFTGHFVLNRYRVDGDGHVCLSPSLPLSELRGSIAVLTAELESLLEQAKQKIPETTRAV